MSVGVCEYCDLAHPDPQTTIFKQTHAWAKSLNAEDKITILADGDCAVAKALGLTVETGAFGGLRMSRFSALVGWD